MNKCYNLQPASLATASPREHSFPAPQFKVPVLLPLIGMIPVYVPVNQLQGLVGWLSKWVEVLATGLDDLSLIFGAT